MVVEYIHPMKVKPHVECIRHRLKRRIPVKSQLHRSPEFAFNSGGFVCDPSKIIPRDFDHGLDGSVSDIGADENKSDHK